MSQNFSAQSPPALIPMIPGISLRFVTVYFFFFFFLGIDDC